VRCRAIGGSVETEVGCGLRECGGRGWRGAGRRGGAGAGQGGEDGLHSEGILHGGDDAQPAATAGTGEHVEVGIEPMAAIAMCRSMMSPTPVAVAPCAVA
jgi:hypothetical protein